MTYGLRILPAADTDVDELAAYIARDSVEQALRFFDGIGCTYLDILEGPARWPKYKFAHPSLAEIRKRAVIGFPNHLIFYRIDADMVEIVRVLHGARDIPALFADEGNDKSGNN